jgi:PAS domain S-box-containing protein
MVLCLVALILTWISGLFLANAVAAPLFIAVTLSGWYCGTMPGLLALAVSTSGLWFLSGLVQHDVRYIMARSFFFVVSSGIMLFFTDRSRRAEEEADAARDDVGALKKAHESELESVRAAHFSEMLQAQHRYEFLADNIPEMVWTARADGAIDYINSRFVDRIGIPFEEMNGWGWEDVVHPDDLAECLRRWNKSLRLGEPYETEYRIRQADGEYRWHIGRAVPKKVDGAIVQWVGICVDIHDSKAQEERLGQANQELRAEMVRRQNLEQQLVQAQKMEAVGRLAGGIAHDFNNLLTIIAGYNDIIRESLDGHAGEIAEAAEEVRKATDRAAELTSHMLAFSRHQIMQPRIMDLNKTIRETEKMLRRTIGEDVQITTRLPDALPPIYADPGHMGQVLMNLAINARDAMPSGGKLLIETSVEELSDEYAKTHLGTKVGRYVMVAVTDSGVGMTPETKRRLFEPFYTTKPVGQGTGLGLSMVYGLVKQAGGEILVYSELGHGATFKIYFPAAEGKVETLLPVEHATFRGNGTVLIVEDEEAVRKLISAMVKRIGYDVLEAGDPEEAMRVAEEFQAPICALLTDVVMPKISGPDLAERMSRVRPDMKVLFMSGYTGAGATQHGVLPPGVPFLQKPFTLSKLAEKLDLVTNC